MPCDGPQRLRCIVYAVAMLQVGLMVGCGSGPIDYESPTAGPVNPGTIEEVMTEDVYGERFSNGDIFLLEPFQQVPPTVGQICLAVGVLEPTGQSPTGVFHYDADLLPVYTAEVYYNTKGDFYFGDYFEYILSEDPPLWWKAGSYYYYPDLNGVETYVLQPLYASQSSFYELATGDMELNLTGLEPCYPFDVTAPKALGGPRQ